jgi:putative copper resistance protein D
MAGWDVTLMVCRFFHYAAALLLFGTLGFQALAPSRLIGVLEPLCSATAIASTTVIVLTAPVWLALQSAAVGASWASSLDPETLRVVLTLTEFGRAWQCHSVLGFGLAAALLLPQGPRRPTLIGLSALHLAGLAFVGHAVMRTGAASWVLQLSHVAHLLAAGFWLGALPPLFLCAGLSGRRRLGRDALVALRRFSVVGQAAVVIILVSGACNAWLIVDAAPATRSPYTPLLLAKSALVGAMIVLAGVNHYVLTPRLQESGARLMLRLSIVGETGLGFAAVAIVSVLGMLSPAG